jgi:aryl-alcohol dehydrogenase-like predicted oxidoreductase
MFNHKNMEYRRLGNTGLKVSMLSFGNMLNYKPENADLDDSLILKCLENGINFFDTAERYADGKVLYYRRLVLESIGSSHHQEQSRSPGCRYYH